MVKSTRYEYTNFQEESDLVVDNDEESVSNEDSGTDIIGEGVPNLQKVLDTEVNKPKL